MKPPIPKIICPNKSLPEWSLLVKGLGDERLAYLSFFRNNNQIPTVEQARAILGLKEAVAIAEPSGVPEPKPVAATIPGQTFPKSKTPKATAPKNAPRSRSVAMSKIEGENLVKLMGLKRLRGGRFLLRSQRQLKVVE